jgi:hypothetical protein
MKQHEREYFVSRLRQGVYYITHNNVTIKVLTPTIEDEFQGNAAYKTSYEKALDEDLMTEEEMLGWMRSRELWTEEDDAKIKGIEKDLERLRVEIFHARNKEPLREQIRKYIRAGEKQLKKQTNKKHENHGNTCEGVASLERSFYTLKRCTFIGNEPYDFQSIDLNQVWRIYFSMFLSEKQSREIARTEPWRSLWLLRDSGTVNLFANKDRELSVDQKNLLIWSRMYDNIQESMECPTDDVIEDDDMLDGWFIVQRKKQEKDKAEAELEKSLSNSKISNSDEIFVMAGSERDAERINNMNTMTGQMIKKERSAVISNQGAAQDLDFRDQQLRMRRQSNEQYKGKFGR